MRRGLQPFGRSCACVSLAPKVLWSSMMHVSMRSVESGISEVDRNQDSLASRPSAHLDPLRIQALGLNLDHGLATSTQQPLRKIPPPRHHRCVYSYCRELVLPRALQAISLPPAHEYVRVYPSDALQRYHPSLCNRPIPLRDILLALKNHSDCSVSLLTQTGHPGGAQAAHYTSGPLPLYCVHR